MASSTTQKSSLESQAMGGDCYGLWLLSNSSDTYAGVNYQTPVYAGGSDLFQGGARSAENGRENRLHSITLWTDEMYKTLLQSAVGEIEEESQEHRWFEIASQINILFNTTVTQEDCEREYKDLVRKASLYNEICKSKFNEDTSVHFVNESDGEYDSTEGPKIKRSKELSTRRMEWNQERDALLAQVVDKCRKKGKNIWENTASIMNIQLGENRSKNCYEDRYRKLSRGIVEGPWTPQEKVNLKQHLMSGDYYKFSREGTFEGIAYAPVGAQLHRCSSSVRRVITFRESREDPYFEKINKIEERRMYKKEKITKEVLYAFLGEFSPKA